MRRRRHILRGLLGVVALLALGLAAVGYATFGGLAPIEDGRRVGATVEIVRDGFVGVAILDLGDDHVALVDCGNDGHATAVLAALARRQLGAGDVSAIFLTHGHADHIAGCARFPQATIYALAAEIPLVHGETNGHGPISRFVSSSPTGIDVGHPLADGDVITVGNAEVRVYAVPGHTAGSAAYLVDGVLFVGDAASVASDGTLRGARWIFSDDTAQDIASLHALGERLASEGDVVTAIVPGHSAALTDGDLVTALRTM